MHASWYGTSDGAWVLVAFEPAVLTQIGLLQKHRGWCTSRQFIYIREYIYIRELYNEGKVQMMNKCAREPRTKKYVKGSAAWVVRDIYNVEGIGCKRMARGDGTAHVWEHTLH